MKKVFYLSTCSTCERILKSLTYNNNLEKQDIKREPISSKQLDDMKNRAGSYEALFSRRAMKFRGLGLDKMNLTEADYKKYILMEYTFLKRPVFIIDGQIFIGNAKATIEKVQAALKQ